jgi:hypothetical protein
MCISLFGLNNSEKKKPKVNCKSKFEIDQLNIKVSKDLKQFTSELFFSFKLSTKRGQIAFSVIETTLIDKNYNFERIFIYPTFNEKTNHFYGVTTIVTNKKIQYKLNQIKIKIVNLCNDTSVFIGKNNELVDLITEEVDILIEKQIISL